ncbi:ferric reductase-like transmembrane domain-containing protein [Nakamurella sp. PAMC28650]|uniref:ferric reductase-like transmembrane domain-containing protein n=1 Tax=Nakamurella sp. PAMC28650 TaxID=2762325 RepID=UPI00164E5080|nr:ferric reductase-like transmembrane domain-containing protein [Nakamurella sp. PAMC28650]QNK81635.1 ferric reductase-like transmembrane domain-containing protein [Nakamurella sp. PAMC28650]
MTPARPAPTSRSKATGSLSTAVVVGIGHALVAAAAIWACYGLLDSVQRIGGGRASTLLLQASGIVALVWAYAGLVLGLVISIRQPARRGGRPRRMGWRPAVVNWHRQLNVAVVALTLLHALVYGIGVPGGSLLVALVPWTAKVDGLGYTLGVLSLYLAVLLGPSYYLRRYIGRRVWLVAHQLAAVSYALGLWHALFLGSDFRLTGIGRTLVAVLQVPLLALIVLRLLRPLRLSDQLSMKRRAGRFEETRHVALRIAVAVGLAVTGLIVLVMTLVAIAKGGSGTFG